MVDDPLDAGRRSALAKREISGRLAEQEQTVMNRTLTAYRAGTLTGEQAGRAIAEISALRDLTFALDKSVRKASEARERLMAPSETQRQGVSHA